MRMIPPHILSGATPSSERKVFDLLSRHSTPGAALHSININLHRFKPVAEADFVLVTAFGVLVLEVKGGVVSQINGIWTSRDRDRAEHRLGAGPFEQAKSAMFAVRDDLRRSTNIRFRFGFGVVLPDSGELPSSTEYEPQQYCTLEDTKPARLSRWIDQLESYWRSKTGGMDLVDAEVDELVRLLRPNFEAAVSIGQIAREGNRDIQRFSLEQFEALDEIEANSRILCRGGAGAGKTFLLIEVAKRELASGNSVLICARSRRLLQSIEGMLSSDDWRDRLRLTTEADLSQIPSRFATTLLVDEGQDLLNLEILSELDRALLGGLENGRWRWFMDDQRQSGFHLSEPEAVQFLEHRGVTHKRFTRNCRNTKEIVRLTEAVTGAKLGKTQVEGRGVRPRTEYFDSAGAELLKIAEHLKLWLTDSDATREQFIVLVADPGRRAAIREVVPARIEVATVEEFKGLERDFVLLCGFSESHSREANRVRDLYTGMTRARIDLRLLLPSHFDSMIREALLQSVSAVAE